MQRKRPKQTRKRTLQKIKRKEKKEGNVLQKKWEGNTQKIRRKRFIKKIGRKHSKNEEGNIKKNRKEKLKKRGKKH